MARGSRSLVARVTGRRRAAAAQLHTRIWVTVPVAQIQYLSRVAFMHRGSFKLLFDSRIIRHSWPGGGPAQTSRFRSGASEAAGSGLPGLEGHRPYPPASHSRAACATAVQ